MDRTLFMSILLTIFLTIGWNLIFRRHYSTGWGLVIGSVLALVGVYWLDHVSLYWLLLISPLSLILGLLWRFAGLRYLLFHTHGKEPVKTEAKITQKTTGKVTVKQQKEDRQKKIFEELERRNIPLQEEKPLSNMTLGELLKEAELNGVEIRARNGS